MNHPNIYRIPNMLLVGSTARNTGKTTFCEAFIKRFKEQFDITGLKVTRIHGEKGVCHRGKEGCGICGSISGDFDIVEETDPSGNKDTCKLLAAGAKRVFWIRATEDYIGDAVKMVLERIPKESVIVCESNALALAAVPGVIVLTHRFGVENLKPSAEALINKADFVLDVNLPGNLDAVIRKISLSERNGKIFVSQQAVYKDMALIILAGGKSSRMGRDKAGLIYEGRSFLETIVGKGGVAGFSEIIISGSEQKILGATNVLDQLRGRGPLSGIHAGLKAARADCCFVVAVDVPKIDFDALSDMARFHIVNGKPATLLVSDGRIEPLIGVYNSDLYEAIHEIIKDKPRRILELFDSVPCGFYNFTGDDGMFVNINTPGDYESL